MGDKALVDRAGADAGAARMRNDAPPRTRLDAHMRAPLDGVGDAQRLRVLERLGILDTPPEEEFDRLTRIAVDATGADASLLSFVTAERQFFKSACGDVAALDGARETPISQSFCQFVVASGEPLVVTDAAADPVLCTNGGFTDLGVRSYLGAPVVGPDGVVLGSFCVLGPTVREWTAKDQSIVSALAATASAALESRRREAALAASEGRMRALLNGVATVLWEADATTWEPRFVSEGAERLLGFPVDAWLGGPDFWMSRLHPDDLGRVVEASRAAVARAEAHETEYRMITAAGETVWVRDLVEVICDESGAPEMLRGVIVDITEAKAAELERERVDERYRALVEHSPICSYVQNGDDFRVTYMSPHVEVLLGVGADEWVAGEQDLYPDLLHPDDREHVLAEVERCRETGDPFQLEYRMIARDGRVVWCYDVTVPVRDDSGAVAFRQGFLIDITEIKAGQNALLKSERRHRDLLDNTTDLIAVIDETGRYRFLSKSYEQQLGDDVAELIGTRASDLVHEDDLPAAAAAISAALDGADPRTIRVRRRDAAGRWRWIDATVRRLEDAPGPRALVIGRDVTARVEAERASERYARQLQMLAIASVEMTLPRTLPEITDRAAALAREIVAADAAVATVVRHEPAESATTAAALAAGRSGNEQDVAAIAPRLHGLVVGRDEPLRLTQAELAARPPAEVLDPRHRLDRGLLAVPLVATSGENLGSIHLIGKTDGSDFTSSDEAILVQLAQAMSAAVERALLEEQLRQAQKMDAIGQLAGGVAHDFNNLLTAITGYTHFAAASGDLDEVRAALAEVSAASDRAAALTRQLLTFSRKHVVNPQVMRIEDEVVAITPMLERLIGENIEVRLQLATDPAPVRADAALVGQVLLNLATNARDAMPAGGVLTIETARVELGEPLDLDARRLDPGSYTCLAVRDNGTGMDERTRLRATEPFFTTKDPGAGTGLGLATVHGIVSDFGGALAIDTAPGAGTTVRAYFPCAEAAQAVAPGASSPAAAAPPDAPAATDEPRRRVLLVEDEEIVRDLVAKMLRHDGYDVSEVASAREAVEAGRDGRYDLLITDVVMPEMTGPELVRALGEKAPPVLFTSGYTGEDRLRHGLEDGVAFLQKPFTRAVLAERIGALLG
ncbi:MAG TPA: PAS domain-containing protein [Gaiellaceae bacterium]|nr:PAS domain-containing protein [Gaiellaceae bacterium]